MKQVFQNSATGEVGVHEVPAPGRAPGSLLIATRFSLISAGTERAIVEAAQEGVVTKLRHRPELARKTLDAARKDGFGPTVQRVRGRSQLPNALGYSSCGTVLEAPPESTIVPGSMVACAGVGYASHAEVVAVPRLLCVAVPSGVAAQDAAYATAASIALHGVRLTGARLGEVVAVIGLGLIGQLTLQLAAAAGCVPVGLDLDAKRVVIAREQGFVATGDAEELERQIGRLTGADGADAVLVTAASRSAEPLRLATRVARDRATVCIVGDVPVEVPRAALFAKELRLVVSRSYGPGRYDPGYEEGGVDYPIAYVRWTEGRNLHEALRLMDAGALRPSVLTSNVFDVERATEAYAKLGAGGETLGILLRYQERTNAGPRSVSIAASARVRRHPTDGRLRAGVIGPGAFARTVLLPALARVANIAAVASATPLTAHAVAARFGAQTASTEPERLIEDPSLDAIVIATRHDTHAMFATAALDAGKHVFVEKPLAITGQELTALSAASERAQGILMVGFNRRHAPLVRRLRDAFGDRGALVMAYRVNAGAVPASHWIQKIDIGGGRLVGEVCHFIDVASYLCGAPPVAASGVAVGRPTATRDDDLCLTVAFADGSVANIVYCAMGDPGLPKERLEVFGAAGAAVLDDFRTLTYHRGNNPEIFGGRGDKGHRAQLEVFAAACHAGRQPWPVADMVAVTRATLVLRDDVLGGSGWQASSI